MANKIKINKERCKGCQICINFCPNGVLKASQKFNKKGYHTVEIVNAEKCTGCGICYIVCPDTAIEIYNDSKQKE